MQPAEKALFDALAVFRDWHLDAIIHRSNLLWVTTAAFVTAMSGLIYLLATRRVVLSPRRKTVAAALVLLVAAGYTIWVVHTASRLGRHGRAACHLEKRMWAMTGQARPEPGPSPLLPRKVGFWCALAVCWVLTTSVCIWVAWVPGVPPASAGSA